MASYPFPVRVDRRFEMIGSYIVAEGVTSFVLPIIDRTIDIAVLSDAFGTRAGEAIYLGDPDYADVYFSHDTAVPGHTVVYLPGGDLTAGPVILGRYFRMSAELTRPFARDPNGIADWHAYITVRQLRTSHKESGAYRHRTMHDAPPTRQPRIKNFTPTAPELTDPAGKLQSWPTGKPDRQHFYIESSGVTPLTVSSVEWVFDYEPRRG